MSKNINITLSDAQVSKINQLLNTRERDTFDSIVARVIERGIYDLAYRTQRNKQQYAAFKEWKQQNQ